MGRKILSILICVLLTSLPVCAFAEDPMLEREVELGYRTDDSICIFFRPLVEEPTPMVIKSQIFSHQASAPQMVREGQIPVTYVLLLDATYSMSYQIAQAKDLVEQLSVASDFPFRFLLIPYNEYGLIKDLEADSKEARPNAAVKIITDQIDRIECRGHDVGPADAILAVLDRLGKSYPTDEGGLVNLILFTRFSGQLKERQEELSDKLKAMPQILLHIVQCVKSKDPTPEYDRGLILTVADDESTAKAARAIAAFIDTLERALLPLEGTLDEESVIYLKPVAKRADGSDYFPSALTLTAEAFPLIEFDGRNATPAFDFDD